MTFSYESDGMGILATHAQVLVNTVNCQGIMGKGLAQAVKRLYPEVFSCYKAVCDAGQLHPGMILPVRAHNGQLILNMATKGEWRHPSHYAVIEVLLRKLHMFLLEHPQIQSLAIPALGCGNGGLDWRVVHQMIVYHLGELPCAIHIYAPRVDVAYPFCSHCGVPLTHGRPAELWCESCVKLVKLTNEQLIAQAERDCCQSSSSGPFPIVIEAKWQWQQHPEQLKARYPGAIFLDVTSRGPQPWQRFSPFWEWSKIPVPFSPGITSQTLEGLWQGLKVFEHEGPRLELLHKGMQDRMGFKRDPNAQRGAYLGHLRGVNGQDQPLLPLLEARRQIFLPVYQDLLRGPLAPLLTQIQQLAEQQTVVLLDFDTGALNDPLHTFSHARLMGEWMNQHPPLPSPSDEDEDEREREGQARAIIVQLQEGKIGPSRASVELGLLGYTWVSNTEEQGEGESAYLLRRLSPPIPHPTATRKPEPTCPSV